MLTANTFAGNITREFVQFQRHSQALLTGHLTIPGNLLLQ